MSALAFLTPGAGSHSVCARTPMERRARAAGARFERRRGWNVPVEFPDDASFGSRPVAFADRSWLTKLEVQAPPAVLAKLGLEPTLAAQREGVWWCPVTPSRVLIIGSPAGTLWDEVKAESLVVDLTCGLAAMALVGPDAHELLARFCAIDVRESVTPVAGFRPGSIARTPGYLLREAPDRLLVLVGWALGDYLWQVVADAAERLGGGPVGEDALDA